MKNRFLAVDDQRMASVMPPLETYNRPTLCGEKVDDFAFTLIPPLDTKHNDIPGHKLFFVLSQQING